MLLVNEKMAGQKFAVAGGKVLEACPKGTIELKDEDLQKSFLNSGWRELGTGAPVADKEKVKVASEKAAPRLAAKEMPPPEAAVVAPAPVAEAPKAEAPQKKWQRK
jgi:hypothetical protein